MILTLGPKSCTIETKCHLTFVPFVLFLDWFSDFHYGSVFCIVLYTTEKRQEGVKPEYPLSTEVVMQ